jgi:hypothetical protein
MSGWNPMWKNMHQQGQHEPALNANSQPSVPSSPKFADLLAEVQRGDPEPGAMTESGISDEEDSQDEFPPSSSSLSSNTIQLGFYYERRGTRPLHSPNSRLHSKETEILDESLAEISLDPLSDLALDALNKKKSYSVTQFMTKQWQHLSAHEKHLLYSKKASLWQPATSDSGCALDYEPFLLASFKFVLYPDYAGAVVPLDGPKHFPDWQHILAVIKMPNSELPSSLFATLDSSSGTRGSRSPLTDSKTVAGCPICLADEAEHPRITSCGHIFCLACIVLYFNSTVESFSSGVKWTKCPLCYNRVHIKELKPLLYLSNFESESPPTKDDPDPLSKTETGCLPHSDVTDQSVVVSGMRFVPVHGGAAGVGRIMSLKSMSSLHHQYYYPETHYSPEGRLTASLLDALYEIEQTTVLLLFQEALQEDASQVSCYESLLTHLHTAYSGAQQRLCLLPESPRVVGKRVWIAATGQPIFLDPICAEQADPFPIEKHAMHRKDNKSSQWSDSESSSSQPACLEPAEDGIASKTTASILSLQFCDSDNVLVRDRTTTFPNLRGLSLGTPFYLLKPADPNIWQ